MSILEEKEKSSLVSYQTTITEASQDYSEIFSFLERIRNFQIPTSHSISSSISLHFLRNDV